MNNFQKFVAPVVVVLLALSASFTRAQESGGPGGQTTQGTTYYVDQTAGSDANAGTSPVSPWQNCPGMAAYTGAVELKPGDTVLFDKADTWDVTGQQGLYLVGGVTYIGDVWGQGTRAELKAVEDVDAGVIRFRDHPTLPTICKGFHVNGNHHVNTGVDINSRFYTLMNGAAKRLENVIIHDTWSEQTKRQYKYGIIIGNNGGKDGYCENVEVVNCVVHDVSRDGICLYPSGNSADDRIKNIVVRGCEVYNTGQDPEYSAGAGLIAKGYVVDAVFEYNYVHHTHGAGIFFNGNERRHFPGVGMSNIHVRYNIVEPPTQPGQGNIRIYDTREGDPKEIKVYGNILLNNAVGGGLTTGRNQNTLSLHVYNNTFVNSFVDFTNRTDTATIEFSNNLIYYTQGAPFRARSGVVTGHSNNIYYRGDGTLVAIDGTEFAASDLSTYEPTASSSVPSFKDVKNLPSGFTGKLGSFTPNTDGLSLRPESVAVNRGMTLEYPFNGSINSVTRPSGGTWDIGAYEMPGKE